MADAAVEFLLENLKQLLIHHAKLIKGARGQVEQLEKDVGDFKLFLKKLPTKKQREDETLKALVRDIRGVVYDAEDIIDAFVTQAAENKTRTYFGKLFNTSTNLISVADEVNTICCRIREIYDRKDKIVNLAIADGDNEVPQKGLGNSLYNSPRFLVRNHGEIKRGKPRLVINYKGINDILEFDGYFIPSREHLINCIRNAKIFSKFDCKSGFYQIRMDEDSKSSQPFQHHKDIMFGT